MHVRERQGPGRVELVSAEFFFFLGIPLFGEACLANSLISFLSSRNWPSTGRWNNNERKKACSCTRFPSVLALESSNGDSSTSAAPTRSNPTIRSNEQARLAVIDMYNLAS